MTKDEALKILNNVNYGFGAMGRSENDTFLQKLELLGLIQFSYEEAEIKSTQLKINWEKTSEDKRMNIEQMEVKLQAMMNDLQSKINAIDLNSQYRVKAMEFACKMFLDDNGFNGSGNPEKLVEYAKKIETYLKGD